MNIIKTFLSIAIASSICNSEPVNISGAVIDSSGKGIAGAIIQLEKAKISTTTDGNGFFTLIGTVGIIPQNKLKSTAILNMPLIENAELNFTTTVSSVINVMVYSIQGRLLWRINKLMDAGVHVLALPVAGEGLYICRLKIGNNEYSLKGTCLRGSSWSTFKTSKGKFQENRPKQVAVTVAMDDILSVVKDGFLDYRIPVSESVMEMAPVKMIVNPGNVSDIDGNTYHPIRIGNQVWMVENLRVTKYNDGSYISFDTSEIGWALSTTSKYCFYENTTNSDSIKKYGALYNWYVVSPENPKKIALAGWHVPSDSEWTVLEKYLVFNGYNWDGTKDTTQSNKIAKSLAAKTDWMTYSTAGTIGCDLTKNNVSGFSALPGGFRSALGGFAEKSINGFWWSTTEGEASNKWCDTMVRDRILDSRDDTLIRDDNCKSSGLSIRLLMD